MTMSFHGVAAAGWCRHNNGSGGVHCCNQLDSPTTELLTRNSPPTDANQWQFPHQLGEYANSRMLSQVAKERRGEFERQCVVIGFGKFVPLTGRSAPNVRMLK